MGQKYKILATAQDGPQSDFVCCPIFEIFYGGARGGGKTMSVLLKWASHASEYGDKAKGLIVRRERTHLIDMISEARALYVPLGAQWKDQAKEFIMPNGAVLRFAYLESDKDADAYQGHNYSFVGIEELTQFADPAPINKLKATLRSKHAIPLHFVATGNPGGVGHHWVKARYIDPAPNGYKILEEEFTNPWTEEKTVKKRVYIPSKIKDNKYLGNDYIATLQQTGSPQLVRAWLEGDWSVIEGAYFSEFSHIKHVIRPFEIPDWWTRYRAFDWGSYRPFCNLWFAVSDGTIDHYKPGDLIVYREWYGYNGKPNEGLKMDADDVAKGILEKEDENITFSVADPAIFKRDGGPSIAERFSLKGVHFMGADNTRIPGWTEVRRRLKGEDEKPSLYIFETCINLIRTLPVLQHDEHKPEDVDTDGEDHAGDTLRYGVMARATTSKQPSDPLNPLMAKALFSTRRKSSRI
jgi:hypothetical protein